MPEQDFKIDPDDLQASFMNAPFYEQMQALGDDYYYHPEDFPEFASGFSNAESKFPIYINDFCFMPHPAKESDGMPKGVIGFDAFAKDKEETKAFPLAMGVDGIRELPNRGFGFQTSELRDLGYLDFRRAFREKAAKYLEGLERDGLLDAKYIRDPYSDFSLEVSRRLKSMPVKPPQNSGKFDRKDVHASFKFIDADGQVFVSNGDSDFVGNEVSSVDPLMGVNSLISYYDIPPERFKEMQEDLRAEMDANPLFHVSENPEPFFTKTVCGPEGWCINTCTTHSMGFEPFLIYDNETGKVHLAFDVADWEVVPEYNAYDGSLLYLNDDWKEPTSSVERRLGLAIPVDRLASMSYEEFQKTFEIGATNLFELALKNENFQKRHPVLQKAVALERERQGTQTRETTLLPKDLRDVIVPFQTADDEGKRRFINDYYGASLMQALNSAQSNGQISAEGACLLENYFCDKDGNPIGELEQKVLDAFGITLEDVDRLLDERLRKDAGFVDTQEPDTESHLHLDWSGFPKDGFDSVKEWIRDTSANNSQSFQYHLDNHTRFDELTEKPYWMDVWAKEPDLKDPADGVRINVNIGEDDIDGRFVYIDVYDGAYSGEDQGFSADKSMLEKLVIPMDEFMKMDYPSFQDKVEQAASAYLDWMEGKDATFAKEHPSFVKEFLPQDDPRVQNVEIPSDEQKFSKQELMERRHFVFDTDGKPLTFEVPLGRKIDSEESVTKAHPDTVPPQQQEALDKLFANYLEQDLITVVQKFHAAGIPKAKLASLMKKAAHDEYAKSQTK